MKYITNGKIVTENGVIENKALSYNERIEGIVDVADIPAGADVIDAEGGYVCPGLVDIHIHGYLGEDVSDGSADGIRKISNGIMKNGVTSWCPTTMTVSMGEINAALDTVRSLKDESRDWDGAQILGVNLEGPFINEKKKGAQSADHIKKPDAAFLLDNADIIRIATLAPEIEGCCDVISKVTSESDMKISIGHTDASYDEANAGIAAGASHITHLFNAQTPLHHRNPGVVGAALTADVSTELIADTFHVNKGLFELISRVKGDKLCLITDCMRAGGMPDGEYTLGGQAVTVKGIQCLLADGTIAGSVLKLNRAVKNLLDNTSLSVNEAVACASLNPARAVGAADRKGSLEAGKDADIIVLDGEFNVVKTIIGGNTKWNSK